MTVCVCVVTPLQEEHDSMLANMFKYSLSSLLSLGRVFYFLGAFVVFRLPAPHLQTHIIRTAVNATISSCIK